MEIEKTVFGRKGKFTIDELKLEAELERILFSKENTGDFIKTIDALAEILPEREIFAIEEFLLDPSFETLEATKLIYGNLPTKVQDMLIYRKVKEQKK